jgi:hypothetical protein
VAVREGAAAGILAREPNRDAFIEQRRERQRLAAAPIEPTMRLSLGFIVKPSGCAVIFSSSSASLAFGAPVATWAAKRQ